MTAAGGGQVRAVGNRQRWMVERSFFPLDPTIGEPIHQEIDERGLLLGLEVALLNPLGQLGVGEVTAAAVEVHHVGQRRLATVVEVRSGELHVSQSRGLERTTVHGRAALGERDTTLTQSSPTEIFGRRTYADVVEPLIAAVLVDEAVPGGEARGRVGQLGAHMALAAMALAGEDVESLLLAARHRFAVPGQVTVQRRSVRDRKSTRLNSSH